MLQFLPFYSLTALCCLILTLQRALLLPVSSTLELQHSEFGLAGPDEEGAGTWRDADAIDGALCGTRK
jgi:hypothetical protein